MRKRHSLYVKNPQAHRLAKQLSQRMGVSMTEAVIYALQEQVQGKGRPLNRPKIDAICSQIASLPVLDARAPEEILGYDEFGIPR